jgi:hypothetical protein
MNQTNDPPHTPLTPAELQELEQLHSKATAGKWRAETRYAYPVIRAGESAIVKTDCSISCGEWVASPSRADANAAYIVAACNALPRLLRELREAQEKAHYHQAAFEEADELKGELQNQLATVSKERDEARDAREHSRDWWSAYQRVLALNRHDIATLRARVVKGGKVQEMNAGTSPCVPYLDEKDERYTRGCP